MTLAWECVIKPFLGLPKPCKEEQTNLHTRSKEDPNLNRKHSTVRHHKNAKFLLFKKVF